MLFSSKDLDQKAYIDILEFLTKYMVPRARDEALSNLSVGGPFAICHSFDHRRWTADHCPSSMVYLQQLLSTILTKKTGETRLAILPTSPAAAWNFLLYVVSCFEVLRPQNTKQPFIVIPLCRRPSGYLYGHRVSTVLLRPYELAYIES